MELYQLKCFLAAANLGNFSRAAEEVHISQPSISKIIGRLEEELGVPLFDRTHGRITLNANGVLFQKYAATALSNIEEGTELLRQAAYAARNTISIGCTSSQRFESILEEAQAQACQCLFQVSVMDQESLVKAFEQEQVDIGFMEADYEFCSPLFERIAEQYFMVYLSENHPFAGSSTFPTQQIEKEIVCFTGHEDDRRFLMHMFAVEGIRPKVFVEYPDHKATAQLINTGAAIGIVPDELYYHRKLATPRLPIKAIPINSRWHRHIYLMLRAEVRDDQQIQQIYQLLKSRLLEERTLIADFYGQQNVKLCE